MQPKSRYQRIHIARFMQKPDEQDAQKTSTNSTWQDSDRGREANLILFRVGKMKLLLFSKTP
jgi:hypothetical protein